jgi:hypothetical protein
MTVENQIRVFISYARENDPHQDWVLSLANRLESEPDIHAVFDQYDIHAGKDLTHFMESVRSADRLVMVVTPNYVEKAEGRVGGVGYESSIITAELYSDQLAPKFIPVLRSGDTVPSFISSKVRIDFRDDSRFEQRVGELLSAIRGAAPRQRPPKRTLDAGDAGTPDSAEAVAPVPNPPRVVTDYPKVREIRERLNEPFDACKEYHDRVVDLVQIGKWAFKIGAAYPAELLRADEHFAGRLMLFIRDLRAAAAEIDQKREETVQRFGGSMLGIAAGSQLADVRQALLEAGSKVEELKTLKSAMRANPDFDDIRGKPEYRTAVDSLNQISDAIEKTQERQDQNIALIEAFSKARK